MQQEEEIFNVSVAINIGLEPLTFTITTYYPAPDPKHERNYRVTRDNKTLGVLHQSAFMPSFVFLLKSEAKFDGQTSGEIKNSNSDFYIFYQDNVTRKKEGVE
ncbi:hypothetical protein AQ505_12460 [Pedobacter sp. PACM 27299]|uniref:hypothetical protein n=1 Tax=Pedobacter sp. PACM 27299 TaxID=1727164 RepID=UPI000706967D|nr:hypothetical protein [Pedobacter sp. PACM 27299]ALL06233.1 hypothetical protein AQ505_12460 [Pedobacter sp. PACM 27299]